MYAIDDEQVIAKEGIEGYPTVRFYGPKGAQEFSGERMANVRGSLRRYAGCEHLRAQQPYEGS